VINEGAPFLFKLHSPNNFIVGGGFFVRHLFLPFSLAWDSFEYKNGAETYDQYRAAIMRFRQGEDLNPTITGISTLILSLINSFLVVEIRSQSYLCGIKTFNPKFFSILHIKLSIVPMWN